MELIIDLPKLFIFIGLVFISMVLLMGSIHIFFIHPLEYKRTRENYKNNIIISGMRYDLKNNKTLIDSVNDDTKNGLF